VKLCELPELEQFGGDDDHASHEERDEEESGYVHRDSPGAPALQ
jgi:hypothetical protein